MRAMWTDENIVETQTRVLYKDRDQKDMSKNEPGMSPVGDVGDAGVEENVGESGDIGVSGPRDVSCCLFAVMG